MVGSAFTIAEMARRSGLSAHTLRYYERIGLIPPLARNRSDHRLTARLDLTWIDFLDRLRRTGMPIRDMKRYATCGRAASARSPHAGNCSKRIGGRLPPRSPRLRPISTIEDKIRTYRAWNATHGKRRRIHGK